MLNTTMISLLKKLASLRLTLVGIVILLLVILFTYKQIDVLSKVILLPFTILSLNLVSALITNRRFHSQPWLFAFHVCLLGIVCLVILSLLVRFEGRVEIAEGQSLQQAVIQPVSQGGWYRSGLNGINFMQGPIEVDYLPGLRRTETRSAIFLADPDIDKKSRILGDQKFYEAGGYRFATTSNKGIAVKLQWNSQDGEDVIHGFIHFPSFPLNDWKQENLWQSPDGEILQIKLILDSPVKTDDTWQLNNELSAHLEIMNKGTQHNLIKGQTFNLSKGQLRFDGIKLWMGYQITYNPVLPWLFTVAFLTILSLTMHFRIRYWIRTQEDQQNTGSIGEQHASIA